MNDSVGIFRPFRTAHEEMELRPSMLGHVAIKPLVCGFDAGLLLTISLLFGFGIMLFYTYLAESCFVLAYTII